MARQGTNTPNSEVRRGSLADAHAILQRKLGAQTPSLETLRVWRKRGDLDSVTFPGASRNDKKIFRLFDLVRLCEGLARAVQVRGPRARKAPTAPERAGPLKTLTAMTPTEQLQKISLQLEALTKSVGELHAAVRERARLPASPAEASNSEVINAVSQLDAVRRMLQQRVDSELSLMRQNAPPGAQPARAASVGGPNVLEFARLTQRVSMTEKAIEAMRDGG